MRANCHPFLILVPETGPLSEYTQQLFMDEGNVVHVVEGRMVTTRPINCCLQEDSDVDSDDFKTFLVASGPSIKAIRTSLDGRYTALQRSKLHVEFIDHADIRENTFIEAPVQTKDAILHGFFWTKTQGAEFVMVTSAGLEFRSFSPSQSSQGLVTTGFQRLANVCWFKWSQPTGILVVGCGTCGAKLQPFHFQSQCQSPPSTHHSTEPGLRIRRLPLLDLSPPWGPPPTPISSSQVWILHLYGRVIIAYHDLRIMTSSTLRLYMLHNGYDSIMPLMEEKLDVGGPIELSVVDDVLVIHLLRENQTDLIDVQLAVRHGTYGVFRPQRLLEKIDCRRVEEEGLIDNENRLQLLYPDLAVDVASGGIFYRMKLDLNAIAAACDDVELLIRFLALRTPSAHSLGSTCIDPMHVLINVFRPLIAQRAMPLTLRRAFEALFSTSLKNENEEIVLTLLQPLLLQKSDVHCALYVVAVLAQFIAVSIKACSSVHHLVVELYIRSYVLAGQTWLLDDLFVRHAPWLDSKTLADRLVGHQTSQAEDPSGYLQKLGIRMLKRLDAAAS